MRFFSSGSYLPFLCKRCEKFSFVLSTNMAAMQTTYTDSYNFTWGEVQQCRLVQKKL